jgi:hypothetical protein
MKVRTLLLILPLALPAAADEVVLRNGAILSGVVREEGEKVVLELDFGTMTFSKGEVRSVRKTADPIKEYEQKLAAATDAKSIYEVAMWAREKGLTSRANDLLRKVISLDPDHEGARKALGFQKIDGKWLEGDELMMARGFLKFNDVWLPKDTVEKMQESEKQLRIEVDRRETETRIARLQQEVELAKVRLERERLERERMERERYDWDGWQWSSWSNGCAPRSVFTIPPPAQANVQPRPFMIQGR